VLPALFERLLADGPKARIYDAAALSRVIAASLSELLATRAPATASGLPAAARTILDYGAAPDPTLSPARQDDRDRLAREIREAVVAFEPRLAEAAVAVDEAAETAGLLIVRITGSMRLGRTLEPFSFCVPIDGTGVDAGVGA
jgi:type VI secretion system lysozyme-like protein